MVGLCTKLALTSAAEEVLKLAVFVGVANLSQEVTLVSLVLLGVSEIEKFKSEPSVSDDRPEISAAGVSFRRLSSPLIDLGVDIKSDVLQFGIGASSSERTTTSGSVKRK